MSVILLPLSAGVCLQIVGTFSNENADGNDSLRAKLSIWVSREKSHENRLLAGYSQYSKENVRKTIGLQSMSRIMYSKTLFFCFENLCLRCIIFRKQIFNQSEALPRPG